MKYQYFMWRPAAVNAAAGDYFFKELSVNTAGGSSCLSLYTSVICVKHG
ncbi:MAG: hypothetical protein IJ815_02800 [Lachnospiraceae bacterium]|nr:hypothetical protein [Lachnospiraceae bacterium]